MRKRTVTSVKAVLLTVGIAVLGPGSAFADDTATVSGGGSFPGWNQPAQGAEAGFFGEAADPAVLGSAGADAVAVRHSAEGRTGAAGQGYADHRAGRPASAGASAGEATTRQSAVSGPGSHTGPEAVGLADRLGLAEVPVDRMPSSRDDMPAEPAVGVNREPEITLSHESGAGVSASIR